MARLRQSAEAGAALVELTLNRRAPLASAAQALVELVALGRERVDAAPLRRRKLRFVRRERRVRLAEPREARARLTFEGLQVGFAPGQVLARLAGAAR